MRVVALFTLLAACSAPAQLRDLQNAEDYARAGRSEEALASYERAMHECLEIRNVRVRGETCGAAHLQRAELLVDLNRIDEAIAAYVEAEKVLERVPARAQACYSAGRLLLEQGRAEEGYRYLWKSITDYPGEAFAADALKRVVVDGRQRAPEHLYLELQKLSAALIDSAIVDNLYYYLAVLAEEERKDPQAALEYYDKIAGGYRLSGFYDDALWHGARLARAAGDPRGAVERLQKLLSTREVAIGAGSYFSIWLDNAQLELGIVLRDDLADYPAAARAFAQLPEDYPASILKDDALFETAVTWQKADESQRACKALARLKKQSPDSKYELERAPKLRSELDCPL
jgi:tetratricopeptide (TPR) repeat protein